MRAALYNNSASGFRKILTLVLDTEDLAAAGVVCNDLQLPLYTWYEPNSQELVIVFDVARVPRDRTVLGKVPGGVNPNLVALSKHVGRLGKEDSGRGLSYTLRTLMADDHFLEFTRTNIGCEVTQGEIRVKMNHVVVLGHADRVRNQPRYEQLMAAPVPVAAPVAAPAAVAPVRPAPVAIPARSASQQMIAMVQQFLDENPGIKIATTTNRKVVLLVA